ncbi:hypothetical protein [Bosea sp. 117]|uniref:hypothetical protein n=1 Tax=Bosea sp. 117 TaxID=1125973 RepID=UPI0020BEE68F|nr:hypothetical protein [Bosea sp. 117]
MLLSVSVVFGAAGVADDLVPAGLEPEALAEADLEGAGLGAGPLATGASAAGDLATAGLADLADREAGAALVPDLDADREAEVGAGMSNVPVDADAIEPCRGGNHYSCHSR